jgi:cell division protein FtsZ
MEQEQDNLSNLTISQPQPKRPKIAVFGIGGAGCNAINNLINEEIPKENCYALNTDGDTLQKSQTKNTIPLDPKGNGGIGAGCDPRIGFDATANTIQEIIDPISQADIVFILAGMGKGTGTGGAGLIAKIAHELKIPSVSIVTRPFPNGKHTLDRAQEGIDALSRYTNALIILKNENLSKLDNNGDTPIVEMFKRCDHVAISAISSIQEIFSSSGLVNLDYNDIRTALSNRGCSAITVGEAEGEQKISHIISDITAHPLMDESISLSHTSSILVHITAGPNVSMGASQDIIKGIRDTLSLSPQVDCIHGLSIRNDFGDKIRVAFIASGIEFPSFEDHEASCELVSKLKNFDIPIPENKKSTKDLFNKATEEKPLHKPIKKETITQPTQQLNPNTFTPTPPEKENHSASTYTPTPPETQKTATNFLESNSTSASVPNPSTIVEQKIQDINKDREALQKKISHHHDIKDYTHQEQTLENQSKSESHSNEDIPLFLSDRPHTMQENHDLHGQAHRPNLVQRSLRIAKDVFLGAEENQEQQHTPTDPQTTQLPPQNQHFLSNPSLTTHTQTQIPTKKEPQEPSVMSILKKQAH